MRQARMLKYLVLALALCLAPAVARAAGFAGVEAMTATVMQRHQSSFSGIALRAKIQPPQLIPQVSLMPTIEYWRNSSQIETFGIEASRKDATLGVDARYDFKAGGFEPYLGAGFGIHFLSVAVDAPTLGLNDERDSLIKGGLTVLGGASFAISDRLANFVELKYHHVTDHEQLKLNFGLGWKL